MKLFSLFVIGILSGTIVKGQILGRMITTDSQAVGFANTVFYSAQDSSVSKASVTDEKGGFRIEITGPGRYFLKVSSIGFQDWTSSLFTISSRDTIINIGDQIMIKDTAQLTTVVIRAEKPLYQQKMEGMVVNVGESILSKGGSAIDILERSPGVVIDRRGNSISLNGKQGVTILINGKNLRMSEGQLIDFLGGMTSDNIDQIELLTTPSAKHDAEGSPGVINIVLKKNKKQGTTGALSVTGGYGWGEKASTSLNLAHNRRNVNLFGSYSFSHDRSFALFGGKGSEYSPPLGGQTDFDVLSRIKPVSNKHNLNTGVDITLNPKLTVGGSLNYNNNSSSVMADNKGYYHIYPDSILQLNSITQNVNKWKNVIASVYMDKKLRREDQISVGFDYLFFRNNNPTDVSTFTLDRNGNDVSSINDSLFSPLHKGTSKTRINVVVGKIDYTKGIGKNIKLETGVKGSITRNLSVSGIESYINDKWVNWDNRSNDVQMKEVIGAVYASINSKLTSSTSLVLGARYEHSRTFADKSESGIEVIDRKLGRIFPDIFLTHKLNENSNLQLSYTQRITRPTYNDLASYVAYNDPISVFTGNPLLKPTITSNIKLAYSYRMYSFSVLFSRDNNSIVYGQITKGPDTSLLYISPQNVPYQNNLTFQANAPFKIGEWWNMNYSFVGGLRQIKVEHTPLTVKKTYFSYSFNFNESFKLPRKYSIELSGWYNSKSYYGNSKLGGFGVINFGIKKELKNKGGTFELAVSDVFRTMIMHNSFGALTPEAFSMSSNVTFRTESSKATVFRLTYSKAFGSSSNQRKRNSSSDDIKGRVRSE